MFTDEFQLTLQRSVNLHSTKLSSPDSTLREIPPLSPTSITNNLSAPSTYRKYLKSILVTFPAQRSTQICGRPLALQQALWSRPSAMQENVFSAHGAQMMTSVTTVSLATRGSHSCRRHLGRAAVTSFYVTGGRRSRMGNIAAVDAGREN